MIYKVNKINILKYILLFLLVVIGKQGLASAVSQNIVISQVKKTVEQQKLISDSKCTDYLFTANAEAGLDLVDVVEKHGGECGGSPEIQHRLFSVYVDQVTHQMLSDKDDPANGTLSLLPASKP